ncbi:leucine-rich repeat-containing protein 43 [Elysia marginata]|uniref:Leucine-rich repeat-containing protein 43 n=1 Tax=Elysia marginata TaxID=1093978 RepID=A0AAV4HU70_9GAST|nr:leucine-rich repeat-containing protein 43 [Elysia marginata]
MSTVAPTQVFRAIDEQLKTLCLKEFPCGSGPWREEETIPLGKNYRKGQKRQMLSPLIKKKQKTATDLETVKRLAQKEKSEALQELVSSHFSPWHLDYSWSEEAKELREIAVKSPWLIDTNFVLNFFKTLRIVDKDVTKVDKKLLRLKNLEEITLSANLITNVNSKNLPASLKVLELCANSISDVSSLCVRPPLLHHLGLGRNCVSFIGDYITGDYWPNLLSLDLSHNNLCDLMEIIRKMTTLPKLRNLILQGNPLSLVPGYRGYTIDCLRRLTVLDDIHISADEKHHFKGLARRREFILDEAKVQICVSYIKGLPCPEEIKHPENQPEFPVVERTYFIQFMFPEETGPKTEEVPVDVEALADDMAEMATLTGEGADTARQQEEEGEQVLNLA